MDDMNDVRNSLLMELIDKMHDRMAEKAYPSEVKEEVPPVEEKPVEESKPEEDSETLSEEDLEGLMKQGE